MTNIVPLHKMTIKLFLERNGFPLMVALLILLISISPRIPLPIHIPKRSFDLRLEDIFLFIVLPIWTWLLCLRPRIYIPTLLLPISIYSLIMITTTLYAIICHYTVWSRALLYGLKEIQYFILFLLVANLIRNRDALSKVSLSIIFIGLLSAVWAFYQISSGGGKALFDINALQGYYQHVALTSHYGIGLMGEVSPLTVATFFSFMSFWAFSFFLSYSDHPIKKICFLFVGLLFTVCSIYSGEKLSIVYFAIYFAVMSFLDFRKMKPFIFGIISFIVIIFLVKEYFIAGTYFHAVERVFHWYSYVGGFVSRIDGWRSVFDTGFPYFLTGVGKGGLHHVFEEAHNNYIKLLFESGIFGLISFIWLLGSIGSLCIRAYRRGHDVMDKVIGSATLCCLVSICVAAMVQDAFKPVLVNAIFWVFVGITTAVDGIGKGESKKQNKNDDVLQKTEVKINVFDFLRVVLKYKKFILMIVIITGSVTAIYYLTLKDHSLPKVMYRSECVLIIKPSDRNNIDGTNLESMVLRVKSNAILKSIFSKIQMQNSEFRNIKYEDFSNMFSCNVATIDASNAGFRISMETADPQLSQNMLVVFISELSNYLKNNTMESLESKKSFLRHNYEVASDIYKKQQYAEQVIFIDKQINNIMANTYYIFKIHSFPSAPTEYYQGSKPANPMVLIVFIIFLALIFSITLSYFLEYLLTLKEEAPEKLRHLRKLLCLKD